MERLTAAALVGAVAVAVAAYGGAEPIWWAAVSLLVYLLGLVGVLWWPGGKLTRLPWFPLLLLLLGLAQLFPLPFGFRGGVAISVAPYETRTSLLQLVAYLIAFYLAVELSRHKHARRILGAGLVGVGSLAALYGLALYVQAHSPDYNATGPYMNRNHFAGLLAMLLPLALGLFFPSERRRPGRAAGAAEESLRWWLTDPGAEKALLGLGAAVLMFAGVLFSRSRMGLLSLLLALAGMVLLERRAGGRARRLSAPALGVFLGGAAVLSLWIGLDPVLARFGELPWADTQRPPIWSDTLRLIQDNLWLGTGLGTFARAFPAVQTSHLDGFVVHAHNDYLEPVAELGLPGAVLLWGGIFVVYGRALRALWGRAESEGRAWLWGCAGSLTAILLHSLTDFNLYLPANALVFSLVLGLAYGLTRERSEWGAEPART